MLKNYGWFNKDAISKNIIDTIGAKNKYCYKKIQDGCKIMGIEAKASYQDYLNGFCCQCEYTYIIAPVGIIPVDKIPLRIGLIEVDLDNYVIDNSVRNKTFCFKGIETVKQCLSRKKQIYEGNNNRYIIDTLNILKSIAYRSTVNDLFKNNEIEIRGL